MTTKAERAVWSARAIMRAGDAQYISVNGRLYWCREGCYRPCEQEARWQAQQILSNHSERHILNEVVHWMCNEVHVDPARVNPPGLMNVQNGILVPETGILLPHTPTTYFTMQLPVEWNPAAYHERADRFLDEVLPSPETRRLLEELVGYIFCTDCRFEKAAMLTGSGANGKRTCLRWLRATLGPHNVSSLSLQDLSDRFRLAHIVDKLANICPDLPREALRETGTFKALVSGDELTAERKYLPPFDFRNRAKLIFSANDLPHSPDTTRAFFRRWIIIPFPHQFGEDDPRREPGLGAVLQSPEARVYLLRLGVEGYRRLLANGGFTRTPEVEAAVQQYRLQTDSVLAFIEECCVKGEGCQVERDVLYRQYRSWAEAAGLRPVGRSEFGKRLRRHVPWIDEYQARNGGKRTRYHVGLALAPGVTVEPQNLV